MTALARLANRYQSLTDSERRVADYVQAHVSEIVLMPLQVLAESCGTSDATVLRFCRSLGFSGYQDFKAALIPELLKVGVPIHQDTQLRAGDGLQQVASSLSESLASDIERTLSNLDAASVEQFVDAILAASNVVIVGLAGSAGVAQIFADSLLSLGIPTFCVFDRVEIERIAALLRASDLLVSITHSGETEEVCISIERAKERGVLTVALTNFAPSKAYNLADVSLLTSVHENLLGSYSCVPRIGQLALLELIVTLVCRRRLAKTRPKREAAGA